MKRIMEFLKEEEGVTAIEYGLIAALIAVFIIGALEILGGGLSSAFTTVGGKVTEAVNAGG